MPDDEFPEGVEVIRMSDDQGRGGLYNMLVPGGFERGHLLLPYLGGFTTINEIGRFRDIWIERDADGQLRYHMYTRVGGPNRADYQEEIARLRAHPLYERDADDSFDATYASFWFRVAPEHQNVVRVIAVDPVDTGERWKTIIDGIGHPQ